LRSLLASKEPDKVEQIRNLILPSNSIAYAKSRAAQLIDRALSSLADLPENDAVRALSLMARYVIARPM